MIEKTPLDVSRLSPAAQKALGPGPGKMMASRGMMPLPPFDQVSVLYQISLEADTKLSNAARETASGLPEKLLAGILGDTKLDPRVLDFFATAVKDKPGAFEALLGNASTDDSTIARLAETADAGGVDLISQNEIRLLRSPQIIASMYTNSHARMSTVDRVIELAVRNKIKVPLPAWDEIARALEGEFEPASASEEAAFSELMTPTADDTKLTVGDATQAPAEEAGEDSEDELQKKRFDELSIPHKVRAATTGDATVRAVAIRNPVKLVAMAAIKSPRVTDYEALKYATNRNLAEDVIRYIANKHEWTKLYGVKVALCRNPKTPIPEATRQIQFLREKDLVALTKSKGVPSATVAQARRLLAQRKGGSGK